MTTMGSKSGQKAKKTSEAEERIAFVRNVKSGKHGSVEKTAIVYARMNEKAQPYEATTSSLYYGVR